MNENDGHIVKEIERLVEANQKALAPIKIGDHDYTAQSLKRVSKPHWIQGPRNFLTLQGLVLYLTHDPDGITAPYIHVEDYNIVTLLGAPEGEEKKHPIYANVKSPVAQDFPFDKFMPVEEMVIKVRSLFDDNEDLREICGMLTNIDSSAKVNQSDDGIAQRVTVSTGGSGIVKENATNKGYYKLKPFRTFQEIEQPEGLFLFRIKTDVDKGASAALFSAGGNAWKLEAVKLIKEYLTKELDGKTIILG